MDITTKYLGLDLKNPLVASAGPLSKEIDQIRKMEDCGISAVTLWSLFEEQIEHEQRELDHFTSIHNESFAEATTFFPSVKDFKMGPDEYLNHIRKAKEAVDIPIMASLNGKSIGGWIDYAKKIEDAGADALELNIYRIATELNITSLEIEKNYIDIVKNVKAVVNIPVAVKMHPFFTSTANMAHQLDEIGTNGLVLFNRFYQPDIDLDTLEVVPNLLLSTQVSMRIPLRWTAMLYGRINADIAATSGIYTEEDVIKMLLAGAKVTQLLSCLLRHGISHTKDILAKLQYWMDVKEYESVEQMRGSMSYIHSSDSSQYERANYMKVLNSYQ
ncbi:MAG: dihydroorotate dehydrogenase [Chlorobiaceae bacterium]|nr:dihydroorotate dehydrogenase [Chlorobiaceae bacterium]MBA4309446.1 dihydroorotate dehydrogenase [Chlorobiaceae bacterium]